MIRLINILLCRWKNNIRFSVIELDHNGIYNAEKIMVKEKTHTLFLKETPAACIRTIKSWRMHDKLAPFGLSFWHYAIKANLVNQPTSQVFQLNHRNHRAARGLSKAEMQCIRQLFRLLAAELRTSLPIGRTIPARGKRRLYEAGS